MLSLALVLASAAAPRPPHELADYLRKPDTSYRYVVEPNDVRGRIQLKLTSQTWQGRLWQHTILIQQPQKVEFPHTAILFITGDGPRPGDLLNIGMLAEATGMPVAMLFDIPNQPIYGMKEDDLIAHTFQQYLKTGDASWPLLFPMVKSALRAMDAVQDSTRKSTNPIERFVVSGASKRGWTTWLVGASKDRRVKAIAPMVIDNLNLNAQMKHQIDSWGEFSEQIQDYTRRGLQAKLQSPEGQRLSTIVDPYSYRADIKVPTLIVKGSNDPYWTVDALDQYWSDLRQPKWVTTVPNAGHGMEGGLVQVVTAVGALARSVAGEFKMPRQRWEIESSDAEGKRSVLVHGFSDNPGYEELRVWAAESDNLDFRPSKYTMLGKISVSPADKHASSAIRVAIPADRNVALFAEAVYKVNGREFKLSSPTRVFRKR